MRLICIALFLFAAGCGSEPAMDSTKLASTTPYKASTVVLCLGDSLTAGYGINDAQAWPALVNEALGPDVQVINAGVSGDTTTGGLERLDWALKANPDVAIVALGANDGLRGIDPTLTKANLTTIISTLKSKNIQVLLAGMQLPTNFGTEHTTAFREIFPTLAKEHEISLLPFLLEGVAMKTELNLADGIHPNEAGHRIIADSVLKYLEPLVESAP